MPAPLLTRAEMLARLTDLFREKGFDGASLSDISDSTGLGKSSVYLEDALFEPMRSSGSPKQKLDRMLDTIDHFYEGGKKACLFERLCASVDVRIEGALVVCAGTSDTSVFARTVRDLRDSVLAPVSRR